MNRKRGSMGRTCSTSSNHREVTQANGHAGSNQRSTGIFSAMSGHNLKGFGSYSHRDRMTDNPDEVVKRSATWQAT